jgi:hypothetical protein
MDIIYPQLIWRNSLGYLVGGIKSSSLVARFMTILVVYLIDKAYLVAACVGEVDILVWRAQATSARHLSMQGISIETTVILLGSLLCVSYHQLLLYSLL